MSFQEEGWVELTKNGSKYFRKSLSTVSEIVEIIEEAKVFLKDLETIFFILKIKHFNNEN